MEGSFRLTTSGKPQTTHDPGVFAGDVASILPQEWCPRHLTARCSVAPLEPAAKFEGAAAGRSYTESVPELPPQPFGGAAPLELVLGWAHGRLGEK
jgi:hypothetical protein